jgi:tetratricopeptide (TPR) repeat protein
MSDSNPVAVDEPIAADPPTAQGARTRWPRWVLWALLALGTATILGGLAWWLCAREPGPTLQRVQALIKAGRYAEAVKVAEVCLAKNPDDPRTLLALAKARGGMADYLGCAKVLERIPDWSIRKTEALYGTGMAYHEAHYGQRAEAAWRACIARDPDGQGYPIEARFELLQLLAMEGRAEAFKSLVWDTYEHLPSAKRLEALTMRLRFEFEQAEPKNDVAALKALVEADPSDTDARAGLAVALARAGQQTPAKEQMARALAERPDDIEIRERALDLLHAVGDFASLKNVLDNRPAAAAARPKIQKYLGILAEKANDLPAAERAFRRAVQADPDEPEYLHRLSLVLFRQGKKAEAEARAAERTRLQEARASLRKAWNTFADAFESDPRRVTAEHLLGMARAAEACGWRREAAACYREALARAPENEEARAGWERLSNFLPANPKGS